MMKRDANLRIGPGDRITYIVVAGPPNSGVNERTEDLDYALAKKRPIDVKYYLDAIKRSLIGIFSPILGGNEKAVKILFTGDHMKRVVKQKPILSSAFAGFKVTSRCKGCKTPLIDGVCDQC